MENEPKVLMGRVRPHELCLLGVSLALGVFYLIGVPPQGSLTAALPKWLIHIWACAMMLSGATGIAGYCLLRRKIDLGLRIEGGSMLLGAGALLIYLEATLQYVGGRAFFGALIVAAWLVANLVRAWQIVLDLRGM